MKRKPQYPLLLLLAGMFLACSPPPPSGQISNFDLILLNARIIDVPTGTVSEPSLVGIIGDTVRIVTDMTNAARLEATRLVDLEGGYIMPGLWDNHVHFRGGDSLIVENKNLLPLFLTHGVTTVRDAGGDNTPQVMQWQQEIRAGLLAGPNIFTSGPKFDGPTRGWEGSIKISEASQIGPAMDSLQRMGVDYVKLYDASLSIEMYYALIREAEARGLPVTGHMPKNADLFKAVEYGLDGTEHLFGALNASSPVVDSLRNLASTDGFTDALVDAYDASFAARVFTKLAKKEFYITPTLFIVGTLNSIPTTDHDQDSLLKYIGPGIQRTYARRIRSALSRSAETQRRNDRLNATMVSMVAPLQKAGVLLMSGSDCGASNAFIYPGASLIGELELMVESANLTPRQALATSVINGPKFLGLLDYYGSISSGKVADIIVLSANPLENIKNIRSLQLVIDGNNIIASGRLLKQ